MKYFLILNPGSRGGKSQRSFRKIFNVFNEAGFEYTYRITTKLDDAYTFSSDANQSGYDVIIAVGGDGTINGVMNGFFDQKGIRISNARMGVIYTGTSPDFCKSYGIPIDFNEAVSTIVKGKYIRVSLGRMDYKTSRDLSKDHRNKIFDKTTYFACCANIGLGASLARMANSGIRKYLGDKIGTFLSLLKVIVQYKPSTFHALRDSDPVSIDQLYNLSVGRTRYIASGIKVNNMIRFDEPGFYCLEIKGLNLFNLPKLIWSVYSGKDIRNSKNISLEYCKTLQIKYNQLNPEVELDGDPVGYLPCRISPSTAMLDLIVK